LKKIIIIFGLLAVITSEGQTITKYYDTDWLETKPEKAFYYSEFSKIETGYKCLSFWAGSKKKKEESLYGDTSMTKPNGLQKVFHKNGNIEDSILFSPEGKVLEAFHYYANRQLDCHYLSTGDNTGVVKEAYDETGAIIKNYVYMRPAEPKGGVKGWKNYLQKNASKELTSGKPEPQTAIVKINFFIDQEGNVMKVKIIESSGNKAVDQDAVRLLLSCPKWSPAIYKNKPIKVPVTLPMTYNLPSIKT
jgi:TonB family protein